MQNALAHILIIEDDPDVGAVVQDTLVAAGYTAELYNDGLIGLRRALEETFALLIVDINLPSLTGLDVCREFKRINPDVPLILLTARVDEVDVITGLEVGADDYVAKPFRPRELLARVRTRLRESTRRLIRESETPAQPPVAQSALLRVFDFVINLDEMTVTKNGVHLDLTATEFELIALLASRPGRPFSRDEILSAVWDTEVHDYAQSITTFVSRLRRKIGDDTINPRYILTVQRVGYKFAKPE